MVMFWVVAEIGYSRTGFQELSLNEHVAHSWPRPDFLSILIVMGGKQSQSTAATTSVRAPTTTSNNPTFLAACTKGQIDYLKEWAKQYSEDDIKAELNRTADGNRMYGTHLAAEAGHHEVLDFLLLHGADWNLTTCRENTPLHIAARANKPECVKILLRHANMMWLKIRLLYSVAHWPPAHGCLLTMLNRDVITLISIMLVQDCISFNELVLKKNSDGYTALEYAMRNQSHACIPLLVSPITVRQLRGVMGSPLHFAAERGSREACELLLKMDAEINQRNARGETPLFRACCAYPEAESAVALFLEWGADFSIKANSGRTAEDEAAARKYYKSVALIKEAKRARERAIAQELHELKRK